MRRTGSATLVLATLLVASSAPAQEETAPTPAESAAARLGIQIQSGGEMNIRSAELTAERDESGAERIVFEKNVVVDQGDLQITCDWLEAIYLDGAGGQADRITARGSVRILQAGREALCTDAAFDNVEQTMECTARTGKARLTRGEHVIKADRIYFDLKTGKFRASGGVQIEVRSEGEAE